MIQSVPYRTVPYHTIPCTYGKVWYRTVRYGVHLTGTVPYRTVRYRYNNGQCFGPVRYCIIAIPYLYIRFGTVPFRTVKYSYRTVRYCNVPVRYCTNEPYVINKATIFLHAKTKVHMEIIGIIKLSAWGTYRTLNIKQSLFNDRWEVSKNR